MPRVLEVFEPPDGGVAEQVFQLCAGLGGHGYEVELAGPLASPVYERLPGSLPAHRLPFVRGYGRPTGDGAALRRLVGLIRSRRPDVVHCHSAKAGVLGRIAGRMTGRPVVYSPHCFPFVGDFSRLRRGFATAVERGLAPLTRAWICVCEAERRVALERGLDDGARLWRVYNGSPACGDDPDADPRLTAFADGGPVAAAVTVLRAQKSVDVLLEAVPSVLTRHPEARIAVIGDGPLRGALGRRAADLGLAGDERFAFIPFEAPAARYLRDLDVYVLPSSWEAFPIGVLEALACGVPQVATDVGGTGEAVVAETGLLVPPGDPAALAEALLALLDDPGRRSALGAASRRRHAEHFTLERMVAETARVYDAVLGRS